MKKIYEVYYFDISVMKWLIDKIFDNLSDAQKYIGKKHKENDNMYHLEVAGRNEKSR